MGSEPEPLFGRIGILLAKKFRRSLLLIAANADADDIPVTVFCRELEDLLGCARAELAHCVENPEQ